MSGKAPPKGPRALLLGSGPGQSQPQSPQPASYQQHGPRSTAIPSGPANSGKRYGGAPPTGPRSLGMNSTHGAHQSYRGGNTKFQLNGHSLGPPPNTGGPGPNTMQNKLGNAIEQVPNGRVSPLPQINGNHEPKPAQPLASNMLVPGAARAAISISMAPNKARDNTNGTSSLRRPSLSSASKPPPPEPTYEPPPPPPPSNPPPPAPPPDTPSPPPPEPLIPPPPPPPPSVEPPPPPPPVSSPPPQPPALPPQPPPPPTVPISIPNGSRPPTPPPAPQPMEDIRPPSPSPSSPTRLRPVTRSSPAPLEPAKTGLASVSPLPGPSSPNPPMIQTPEEPKPEPRLFSLPPPLEWPPPRSALPSSRPYKVIYDATFEKLDKSPSHGKRKEEYYGALMDAIRATCPASVVQDRIKGKGKGKEILHRYDGEVLFEGAWTSTSKDAKDSPRSAMAIELMIFKDGVQWVREKSVLVSDPRKSDAFRRRPPRTEFYEVKYEYDVNSAGPPPSTAVLITNLPVLAPNPHIRRHFGAYGHILSFEPQIDKEKGSALGIVWIKFATHDDAKRCAEKENGRKLSAIGLGLNLSTRPGEGEELRVVLDGEGTKLKAVLKEIQERKRRGREDLRRDLEKDTKAPTPLKVLTPSAHTPLPNNNRLPAGLPPRPQSTLPPLHHSLPQNPIKAAAQRPHEPNVPLPNSADTMLSAVPMATPAPAPHPIVRRPPPALVKARNEASRADTWKASRLTHPLPRPPLETRPSSSSSTPIHHRRDHDRVYDRKPRSYGRYRRGSPELSRSPSPDLMASRMGQREPKTDVHRDHEGIMEELAKNGKPHVKFDSDEFQVIGMVKEADIRALFEGFDVDKVLKSREGLYVTFHSGETARRAESFINHSGRKLAHSTVSVTLRAPPPQSNAKSRRTRWDDDELVDQAKDIIVKELAALLQKDIMERLVAADVRKMVNREKSRMVEERENEAVEQKSTERKGLKGLSFKKRTPKTVHVVQEVVVEHQEEDDKPKEEQEERPRKRPKKEKKTKKVAVEDVESEDEPEPEEVVSKKRPLEEEEEEEEVQPTKKKLKPLETKLTKSKKSGKKPSIDDSVEVVLPEVPYETPEVAVVHVSGFESSLSPSRSPSPVAIPTPRPPSPTPPPDFSGVCDDDEDIYFARLVLSGADSCPSDDDPPPPPPATETTPSGEEILPPRKHLTGSARSEGFYKITHAEKAAYVTQYQARNSTVPVRDNMEDSQPQHVTSSRSNRANARRRAQGLEEINQVQRAVALSKGETGANEVMFKFNQLQTRKKHLRFARSPIHDWGLYAMERIARGEMVIEYVGEVIRAQVADKREKTYERQGIGSSYLFRIDEDLVVDATKKGNLGRLINHSCDPNCTAKIITISGEKKIVIYAKQDIELGDEITYDYHFPFEQDKIPCLCGSAKCRGFLN